MTWIVDQECDILTKGYGFSEPTRLDPNHLKEKFIPEIIMSKFNILFKFKYFDLVLDPKDSEWTFNDVGFIKARIRILYSTLRQYVALFGSPLPVKRSLYPWVDARRPRVVDGALESGVDDVHDYLLERRAKLKKLVEHASKL